ncbi:gustatory receptor for sugar taste 43a-like [Vespula maculifrons]|uniref:Gustatory receptor for sugar taste 43a-like n=1 Tax=Vespula maculifrons TaxID=7453 RepID=A0ABD2CNW0_VESMC
MFRSKEFQRAVIPLIIVNSIFYIGLLEYFVDRRIRTIDIIFMFKNAQETKMSGIITYIQFFEYTFLYIILVFIGIAKRQRIKLFVQQLENCTQAINDINVSRKYFSLFRYQCITTVILIIMITYIVTSNVLCLSYYKLSLNYGLKLQYFYFTSNPTITMMIIDFNFVFWMRQVNCSIHYKKKFIFTGYNE